MISTNKVNDKNIIIKPQEQKIFHCFKLNDSSYVLFDVKMDMPLIFGSLSVITSTKLPPNSIVFYYKLDSLGYFKKLPNPTVPFEISGNVVHKKPALRRHIIDEKKLNYHCFKLTGVLFSLFDDTFKLPIIYGGNDKINKIMNYIPKNATIFFYKEDIAIKPSFKFWKFENGKK